jgi:RNA polymerase sigma factor (sigma-70 family)
VLDAAPETAFDRYVVPELAVLYRVARGLTAQPADAEDLVQDTLVRAFRAIGSFDGRHPRAWLLTILRRAHLNRVRRRLPHLMDSADFLHDRRQSLYAAVVGVHITMLGFAFATLTVVLGYAQSPRFQVLRDSRSFSALFSVFINALRAFALAFAVTLVALLFDRNSHPEPLLTTLAAGTTVTALATLVHLLFVLEKVVIIVTRSSARAPGA